MQPVYIAQTNCITPLGFNVPINLEKIEAGETAISLQKNHFLQGKPYYAAAIDNTLIDREFAKISTNSDYTKLEKMLILSLFPIVKKEKITTETGFILSTTKGNICELQNLNNEKNPQIYLSHLAQKVAAFFEFKTQPIVISNACVSGIMSVSIAKRLIQSTMYKQIFVVAADEISEFVLSGFNSFQAMSEFPCKPYSKNRSGVTLGEAAAATLITIDKKDAKVKIIGDSSINDANHISGPSRTGEGLFRSIQFALNEAKIQPNQVNYLSAHGTATPFNDEMEAIAFNRSNLEKVPINSLKGYYGHTLGAAGLLETVIAIDFSLQNKLIKSIGFEEMGVSQDINIIQENKPQEIKYFLKTASGFGGCNTAVIFEKM